MQNTYHHGDLKNALIQAGIDILAEDGISRLSLRKVAKRAGASHNAPYAHFRDKQALVAAISMEGYQRLYTELTRIDQVFQGDPLKRLVEVARSYVQFSILDPAHFKITFSGVIDKENEYPAFVEIAQKSFTFLTNLAADCQEAGILPDGPCDLFASHL